MENEEIKESKNITNVKMTDVFKLTLQRWPWILVSVVICVGLAFIYVQRKNPVYTRTAKIALNDESNGSTVNSISTFIDMGLTNSGTNRFDEIIKLKSYDVMREVVETLNLTMNYTMPKGLGSRVVYGSNLPVQVSLPSIGEEDRASMNVEVSPEGVVRLTDLKFNREKLPSPAPFKLGTTVKTAMGPLTVSATPFYKPGEEYRLSVRRTPMISTIKAYSGKLDIALEDKLSNTVQLTIKDHSTQRAEDVINTLLNVYNEKWLTTRNQVSDATQKFINERLIGLEKELGGVDRDIATYQADNLLPNVDQAAGMYLEDNQAADKKILDINNQLQVTRYMRQYLASAASRNEVLPSNSGIGDQAIERQIAEYNAKVMERNRLVDNSSDNHPMIRTLDSELASMRAAIIGAIDNQIAALSGQLRNVMAEKGKVESRIARTPIRANYLLGVERQQKVKESLYLYLLQKREENELSRAYTAYNTEVVLRPFGSNAPVAPRKVMTLAGAFILGLFIPFGINYLLLMFNTTIRGKEDLESLTIPVIGEIPNIGTGGKLHFGHGKNRISPIVVEPGNRNLVNDAFRVLRANIRLLNSQRGVSDTKEEGAVTMVTSHNAGSGKSFICDNLAVTFALRDKKVVVIDGDLRHATTSCLAGSPSKGLTDYLAQRTDDWKSLVVSPEVMHGADVLPVGKCPLNPTELLEGSRFGELVKELKQHYDYILIDCPPLAGMADASLIGSVAEHCVFVVRVGYLKLATVPELEKLYESKKFRNMSLVINGTATSASYSYAYSESYHYGAK